MNDFIEMGGYGAFVWPSYLISAAILFGLAVSVWRRGKALDKKLSDIQSAAHDEGGDADASARTQP